MKELAVVERYLYGKLGTLATAYGWAKPQIAPFDLQDGADAIATYPTPVFFFRLVATGDRNAIGPGPRLLAWADYEIGLFHAANSFGAEFATAPPALAAGTVSLLTVLGQIDDLFQNYTPPIIDAGLGGTVYSIERKYAVRIPERSGGKLFRRDGGVYRFHVEAD
ncbi:MAG: hypothetical protein ABL984_00295 [Pyrinomonadaceae bacterium]